MRRVLVFGIDAATLDLLEPWSEQGKLPTIGRLLTGGSYAPLRSTVPALSPPAWTSLITGQNPGKHGIYDFVHLLPGSYRLTSTRRNQTRFRTIFDLASQHDRTVLAMNIPLTYPPAPVNGSLVAGLGAPLRGQFAYPAALREELLAWDYRIDPAVEYAPGNEADYIAEARRLTRVQAEAFKRLMQRDPWDLAMIVFRVVDEFQSFLWHHMDATHPSHNPALAKEYGGAILESYQLMDTILGEVIELAGPETTVLIVSDHGGGPFIKEVFLNAWLAQHGFLQQRVAPSVSKTHTRVMRRLGLTREKLAPKLDWPLAHFIQRRIPQRVQHRLVPEQGTTLANSVDWSKTRAYSFGNMGQIFVNLRGREPQGIVAPGEEYERLLDEITAQLYALRDGTLPVVDRVYRRSELYNGPYAEHGADLNVLMRDMNYIAHGWREMTYERVFAPASDETGTHRPLGVIIGYGPGIAAAGRRGEAQIVDVAPTILWLLGLPLPDDLDGKTIESFLHAGALGAQPPVAIASMAAPAPHFVEDWGDSDDEAAVLERLKSLGYVD
ncbi:MAG: alkaline phosphatase family protein [Herpetosiphon sp.]